MNLPMASIVLRTAASTDVPALASLSGELGYETTTDALASRLSLVAGQRDQIVLVACVGDMVVGWIHGAEEVLLEDDRRCEIRGLVVSRAYRRQQIGQHLVAALERWATARGLAMVSVRSNVARDAAHPFYEALGYRRTKTQHVYRKALGGTSG